MLNITDKTRENALRRTNSKIPVPTAPALDFFCDLRMIT